MKLLEKAERIRIYIGEDDKHEGRPLADAIVEKARAAGLAGATVFRGLSGFGANSLIHTTKILRLSEDLPVVIEIVDHPDRLEPFKASLDAMITEGMITSEPVQVIAYRHAKKR
jgi:PII-like signaling protein